MRDRRVDVQAAVWRPLLSALAVALACVFAAPGSDAHKPITSPYTFNEDVVPIVQRHCAACHAPGGVAPMSLLTHAEAVPWGESMRAELMAGHMPPWGVESAPIRFRNVLGLTARELNVLLTWASGGTPAGDPAQPPATMTDARDWPLGEPDVVIPLDEVALAADVQDQVVQFTVPAGLDRSRWLRAVDLRPGNAAIVRSATIALAGRDGADRATGTRLEPLLALWVPGDVPVPLDSPAGWHVPSGAELTVRVRYRKTWEYERQVMRDASRIGLYFADEPASELRALDIAASVDPAGIDIPDPVKTVAIYAQQVSGLAFVEVIAVKPDGSRDELIAFRPREEWARRYWFREPITLPGGTRVEVRARGEDDLLPPGALPRADTGQPLSVRLTLNVIPMD